METDDETSVEETTPASGPDTSNVLNESKITKLGRQLDTYMNGIWRVTKTLKDAAITLEDSKEEATKAEADVDELIKKLGPVVHNLAGLADDARVHFGIAEESDGELKRKPPTRKRKPNAAPATANKKRKLHKKKAGKGAGTSSSPLSLSLSSSSSDSSSDSDSNSEHSNHSLSDSGDSDKTINDEDESSEEDSPAAMISPPENQDSRAG